MSMFGGEWKSSRCQVTICLQFPEYMRRLYICRVRMSDRLSDFFKFVMVAKFVMEECVEEVAIVPIALKPILCL